MFVDLHITRAPVARKLRLAPRTLRAEPDEH